MFDCGLGSTILDLALQYEEYPEFMPVLLSTFAVDDLPLTSEFLGLLLRSIPYLTMDDNNDETVQQLVRVVKHFASKAYELLIDSQLLTTIDSVDDPYFKESYIDYFFQETDPQDPSTISLLTYMVEQLNIIPYIVSRMDPDGENIFLRSQLKVIFKVEDRWVDLIPRDIHPSVAQCLQIHFEPV